MANRVLFGKRGSDYGLFVTKPGANVISCDPEDMLFDSRRKEIVSNPLTSGTGTVTFTNSSGGSYLNTDTGFVNFGTTYDFIPILIFCFVDSNTNIVYPMYHELAWSQNVTTNPAGEPVVSTSQGYIYQSYAQIYTDKFKLYVKRWWSRAANGSVSLAGFSTGTHTYYWAIFPVGEASTS